MRQHKLNFAQLAAVSWAALPCLQTLGRHAPAGAKKLGPFLLSHFTHTDFLATLKVTFDTQTKAKDFWDFPEARQICSSAPRAFRYWSKMFGRKTLVAFCSKQLCFDKCCRIDLCCASLNWITMHNPPWNRTFTFHWPSWKNALILIYVKFFQ